MKSVEKEDDTYKPDDMLHRVFNWELIRSFGESSAATVSIAMPFIGYAILYQDQFGVYLEDIGTILAEKEASLTDAGNSLPLSKFDLSLITKLNLLYLGGFLVGSGTILYRIFAPKTVKKYYSIGDFCENEIQRATARKLRSMTTTILSRRKAVGLGLLRSAPWLDRKKYSTRLASSEYRKHDDDQIKYDVLGSFYNVENRYYTRWVNWPPFRQDTWA